MGEDFHTQPVLEALLDQRIVNVGQDLELLHRPPQARQLRLLHLLAALDLRRVLGLERRNLVQLLPDLGHLLLPVRREDGPGLLERLVGQLLKGDGGRGAQGDAPPARADGHLARLDQGGFKLGEDAVGVEVERARLLRC
jgi:hypothetical protein